MYIYLSYNFLYLQARKATLTKAKNEKSKQATITPVINLKKPRQDDSTMVLVSLSVCAIIIQGLAV